MADSKQFLRLTFADASYLLPSGAGFTIEPRENLQLNHANVARAVAWRTLRNSRWPAFALDRQFRPIRHDDWQRAVFVEAVPHALGVVVDEVQMLPSAQVQVVPYTPLGAVPTRAGHIFNGAWVTEENEVMLILEPQAFVVHLQSLGE